MQQILLNYILTYNIRSVRTVIYMLYLQVSQQTFLKRKRFIIILSPNTAEVLPKLACTRKRCCDTYCITTQKVLFSANWNDDKLWSLMIAGMVQKLQECKVDKFVSLQDVATLTLMEISITKNSKEHRFRFRSQWENTFQKQGHILAAELPSEHRRCNRSIYNLPSVYFPDFMYLVKQSLEICLFLYMHIQATPLSLQ